VTIDGGSMPRVTIRCLLGVLVIDDVQPGTSCRLVVSRVFGLAKNKIKMYPTGWHCAVLHPNQALVRGGYADADAATVTSFKEIPKLKSQHLNSWIKHDINGPNNVQ